MKHEIFKLIVDDKLINDLMNRKSYYLGERTKRMDYFNCYKCELIYKEEEGVLVLQIGVDKKERFLVCKECVNNWNREEQNRRKEKEKKFKEFFSGNR